jgi:hypothetical protein
VLSACLPAASSKRTHVQSRSRIHARGKRDLWPSHPLWNRGSLSSGGITFDPVDSLSGQAGFARNRPLFETPAWGGDNELSPRCRRSSASFAVLTTDDEPGIAAAISRCMWSDSRRPSDQVVDEFTLMHSAKPRGLTLRALSGQQSIFSRTVAPPLVLVLLRVRRPTSRRGKADFHIWITY